MFAKTGIVRACIVLVQAVWVAGCVSTYPPEDELQAVGRGEQSAVVIGIRTRWNGSPSDPVDELAGMSSVPLHLTVASYDDMEGFKSHRAYSLGGTDESGRLWTCLFLQPGSYYVWSVSPGWLSRDIQFPVGEAGGFWLQVVADHQVQYAGTLNYDLGGKKFIEEKFYKRFTCSIKDERQAAMDAVKSRLSRFGGEPVVSLMQQHGGKLARMGSIFPTLVVARWPNLTDWPNWEARAKGKAFEPLEFIIGGGSSGLAALGAAGIFIVYYPIGVAIGSSWAEEDIKKWQPCIEALAELVEVLEPDRMLSRQFGRSLGSEAVVVADDQEIGDDLGSLLTDHRCRSLLLADIQRIGLRECAGETFCVEVATRIRLWDGEFEKYLFDRVVVYTNPKGIHNSQTNEEQPYLVSPTPPPPYETSLEAVSAGRPMDDYCGQAGVDLFGEELSKAIEQTVGFMMGWVDFR